jgi:threonylcarbamoyladenosine tRNA methylthiotransferase MtaB
MTFAFKIFGCRLNQAEGADWISQFEDAGFERVPFGGQADVVLFYSCTVTQKAENECLKAIRHQRMIQPNAFIVLAGCAVETCDRATLAGVVDLFIGRGQKEEMVRLVGERRMRVAVGSSSWQLAERKEARGKSKEGTPRQGEAVPKRTPRLTTQRATLKVQDGCDFRCSYCIVPHARGEPRSRPLDVCLAEARAYCAAGFQEIVITGCNTACYRDEGRNLVDLLRAVLGVPGLGRLRIGSIEPGTVEGDIIVLMTQEPRLCRFLHLPIQSGSDRTLQRMKRRYTISTIRQRLKEAFEKIPDLALGTDLITGFPGETLDDFEETCQLVRDFPFANVHVFPYSERPGTPAAEMGEKVPVAERKRRAKVLSAIADQQRVTYMSRFKGREVTFLVERVDHTGCATGWSAEYLPCRVQGFPASTRKTLQIFTVRAIDKGVLVG